MRTLPEIIEACGGPERIEKASGMKSGKPGQPDRPRLSHWAVRKWPQTGIPERHWPLVQQLSNASIEELYGANRLVREVA
jgi:hypothetical protein